MTLQWLLTGAAVLVAAAAFAKARRLARRLERLTESYWELRYDSFLPDSVWEASRDLGKERFPKHDELLDDGIKATILNVKANRFVWDGVVTLTRIDRWRPAVMRREPRP